MVVMCDAVMLFDMIVEEQSCLIRHSIGTKIPTGQINSHLKTKLTRIVNVILTIVIPEVDHCFRVR